MKRENELNPYKRPQLYWCNVCDTNTVDSTKPETGKFYHVYGHDFSTGDCTSIFFAICPECNPIQALNELFTAANKIKLDNDDET
jgi:hypothetical protein